MKILAVSNATVRKGNVISKLKLVPCTDINVSEQTLSEDKNKPITLTTEIF
jgi:hypothetical protein